MTTRFKTFTMASCISIAMLHSASAALLIEYDFTGSTAAATFNIDDELLIASIFTSTATNPSFNTNPSNNTPSGPPVFQAADWSTDEAGAKYFAFSIVIDSGHYLQIDSLSLYQWSRGTNVDPNIVGPKDYKMVVSQSEDFSTGTTELGRGTLTPTNAVDFVQITGNNGGVPVTVVETAYFRIYGWDGSGTHSTNTEWRVDDIGIYGSIMPIPEPASGMLFLFVGFLLIKRRFRTSNKPVESLLKKKEKSRDVRMRFPRERGACV